MSISIITNTATGASVEYVKLVTDVRQKIAATGSSALFNLTALTNIRAGTTQDKVNTAIATGGVIKREYVPHDITPLVAVTLGVEPEVAAVSGDKYFDKANGVLHTYGTSYVATADASPATGKTYYTMTAEDLNKPWTRSWTKYTGVTFVTGVTYYEKTNTGWNDGTYGGATNEEQRGQRLYVDMATARMYHWENDAFTQVGYNAEDITAIATSVATTIASSVASAVVASAQGGQFEDSLYAYTEINN